MRTRNSRQRFIPRLKYKIVEKKNPLAVHGLFDSFGSAYKHLQSVIPEYVAKGYFADKTLRANDFEIVSY